MFTTCPDCGTVFRISTEELRVAGGYVRCGNCSAVFNAVLTLSEEMPAGDTEEVVGQTPAVAAEEPHEDLAASVQPAADEPDAHAFFDEEIIDEAVDEVDAEHQFPGESGPDETSEESGTGNAGAFAPPPGALTAEEWLAQSDNADDADTGPGDATDTTDDWSQLFDEEDLRDVSQRIAITLSTAKLRLPDDPAEDDPAAAADDAEALTPEAGDAGPSGDVEDEDDVNPVFVIGEDDRAEDNRTDEDLRLPADAPPAADVPPPDALDIGPWAWEPPPDAAGTGEEPEADQASEELPERLRRPAEQPAPDLWAEEFGDLVLPEDDTPALARDPDESPKNDVGALPSSVPPGGVARTWRNEPAFGEAAASHTPGTAEPQGTAPRDPGEFPPLPPLWTPRPPAWDYPAGEDSPSRFPRWLQAAGIAVLAVLLVAQFVHRERDVLATSLRFGPLLERVYGAAGIELFPRWDLNAYEIRGTEAVAGRSQPGALDVLARVNIVGTSPVGLPLVRVTLRDRFGNVLGARVLEPADYLEPGSTIAGPLFPGAVVPVRVSLADPGADAYGYEVDICVRDRRAGVVCQAERAPFRR